MMRPVGFSPVQVSAPKFSGEVQQQVFTRWLESFPNRTKGRLDRIDSIPEHEPMHISLAVTYGNMDARIDSLNKMIIGLISARKKAQSQGNEANLAEATGMLTDLRAAINTVLTEYREGQKK